MLDAIFFCFFIAAGDEIDVPLVELSLHSFRCTSSPVRSLGRVSESHGAAMDDYIGQFMRDAQYQRGN